MIGVSRRWRDPALFRFAPPSRPWRLVPCG